MKAIEKVEYRRDRELIQVSTKEEVEGAIMQENLGRFQLAYVSPLLKGDLCDQLGMSWEGILSEELLENRVNLDNFLELKEVLSLFSKGRIERIDIMITTEQWNNY